MFLLECTTRHEINFNESCCLRHLIEMNYHAELCTLSHKYAKLLIKTLNHHFKLNSLNFENLKLEESKHFLDIMSKYISHFYFLNKFEFSKLLVKISLKASEDTLFKDHPEVIIRRCAIYNNLACVYEKTSSYAKAMKYGKYHLKYANNLLDKAVTYNNLARICIRIKDESTATQMMKSCYDCFKEEVKKINNERVFKISSTKDPNIKHYTDSHFQNRIKLIGFLYYNYGSFLTYTQKEKESNEIFRKGYEFSLSCMGEYDIITSKFAGKIGSTLMNKSIKNHDKMRNSIDSIFDSDLDYMSIFDNNNNITMNKTSKAKFISEDTKGIRISEISSIRPEKKNTMVSTSGTSQAHEIADMKNKLDLILKKFDKIDMEKIDKLVSKRRESSNSRKEENRFKNTSFEKSNTDGSTKNENLKKLFDPSMKKLLIKGEGPKGEPISFTEDMLNEIMNEIDLENSLIASNRSKSITPSNCNDLAAKSRNKQQNLIINSDNNEKLMNKSMSTIAPRKRSLRDMFRKAVPIEKLEAIDSSLNKSRDGGLFSQLINSLNEDNDDATFDHSKINIKSMENTIKIISQSKGALNNVIPLKKATLDNKNPTKLIDLGKSNDQQNKPKMRSSSISGSKHPLKKSTTLFNAFMNETEEIIPIVTSDQKEVLDFKQNPYFINLNMNLDIKEENNESAGIKTEDSNLKKPKDSIFQINVELDEGEGDKYEFTTLYYKNDKKSPNETSSKPVPFVIKIEEDVNDDNYECTTLYYKRNGNEDRKFQVGSLAESSKKVESKPFVINVQQDPIEDNYQCTTFYIKNDGNNIDDSINEWENQLIDPTQIEKEIDFKLYQKEYNLIFNKKKKEIDLKKHFEHLVSNIKDRVFLETKVFTIIRELNNEFYKIAISYGKNKEGTKGIYLKLFKSNSKNKSNIAENYISFEKLKSLYTKIAVCNSLARNVEISMLNSIDKFIEKVFIYHCYILQKDNSVLLGVLTRPLGICFNRAYEFTFLNTICIIDIFITQCKEVKFFIYNKNK